jgi:AhpD family alkylhydroperoxidase
MRHRSNRELLKDGAVVCCHHCGPKYATIPTVQRSFLRRYYKSLGQLGRELIWPLGHRRQLRLALRGELISVAFRERLMLVVTAVNACRYCAYYHVQQARLADLPEAEIRQMLAGDLQQAPAAELPALLYAQEWAQHDGRPDPAARQRLQDTYGLPQAEAIEAILRLIRLGNLGGNTLDYWLYRLSWGRLGNG